MNARERALLDEVDDLVRADQQASDAFSDADAAKTRAACIFGYDGEQYADALTAWSTAWDARTAARRRLEDALLALRFPHHQRRYLAVEPGGSVPGV